MYSTAQVKIDKSKIWQKTENKNTNKKVYDARDMILLGPLALFERWLLWSFDVLYDYYVIFASHVYGEGDSNLPCQAGFKLPSPSPISIHLVRGAKKLPNAQRTVQTHAKLILFIW